jgi:hypothetical protein
VLVLVMLLVQEGRWFIIIIIIIIIIPIRTGEVSNFLSSTLSLPVSALRTQQQICFSITCLNAGSIIIEITGPQNR